MRERPILFSDEMVRAILDGRKSQARRVVKPQPPRTAYSEGFVLASQHRDRLGKWIFSDAGSSPTQYIGCPYGQPGDRLWVREAFAINPNVPSMGHSRTLAARHRRYRADGGEPWFRWKPSIHMPRWASRITLEITGVRVERVQDITEDDAVAEGRPRHNKPPESISTVEMFAASWNGLNGKRGYGWDANPWVWVIDFNRAEA